MSNGGGWSFDRAFDSPSTDDPAAIQPIEAPGSSRLPDSRQSWAAPGSMAQFDRHEPVGVPPRSGQVLCWVALSVALAGAVIVGAGVFRSLATVGLHAGAYSDFSDEMNLTVFGLCILALTLAASIVAVVRARPKLVGVIALIATMVLPVIAAVIGFKLGLDALVSNVQADVGDVVTMLSGVLEENGFDNPEPFLRFLFDFFF